MSSSSCRNNKPKKLQDHERKCRIQVSFCVTSRSRKEIRYMSCRIRLTIFKTSQLNSMTQDTLFWRKKKRIHISIVLSKIEKIMLAEETQQPNATPCIVLCCSLRHGWLHVTSRAGILLHLEVLFYTKLKGQPRPPPPPPIPNKPTHTRRRQ